MAHVVTYRELKWTLNQLSEGELDKPATAYDTYFGRTIPIAAVDHLSSVVEGRTNDPNSPLVVILSQERE